MKKLLKLFIKNFINRKSGLTNKEKSIISEDTSNIVEEILDEMEKESNQKDEKIHNLFVDLMLLENDIKK